MTRTTHRWLPAALLAAALGICTNATAHEGEHHGNHDAHHGGFVLMSEDLHFELVALPTGVMQVFYTDAQRKELPAAAVSDVALEISRPGAKPELVDMAISESGDGWTGKTKPITDPNAIIRVAFVHKGKSVMTNVPASALPKPKKDVKVADKGHDAAHHDH